MRTAVTALCLLALSSNVVVSIPHGQDQASHWRQFETINENGNNQRSYDTLNIAQKYIERENNHDPIGGGLKKYLHRLVPQNNPEEYRVNEAHTLPVNNVPNPGQGNEDQAASPLTNDNPAYIDKQSNTVKKSLNPSTRQINHTNAVYPYRRKFLIIHSNGTIESTTDFEYIKRTIPNYKILTTDQALLENPSLAKGIKESFSNNPESTSASKNVPSIIINKKTGKNEKNSVASNQLQKKPESVFNKPLPKQEAHVIEGNETHTISESLKDTENKNNLPIKQYLIVHPNGTVERTTDINYIKKAVPNYTLVDKSKISSLHPIYQDILKTYYGAEVKNINKNKSDETKPTGLEPADVNSGGWRPPNIKVNDIKTSSTNSGSPKPGPRNDVVVDNQHSKPSPKEDGTNPTENIEPITKQAVATNLNSTNGWHPPRFSKGSTVGKQHLNLIPKEDGTNPVDKNEPTKSTLQTSKSDETKPTGLEPADVNSGGWRPPNINVNDIKTSSTNSGSPKPGPRNDVVVDNQHSKPSPKEDGTNPTENIEPITKQAVATNLNSTNGWHPPRFSKGSTVGKQHLNLIPKEDGTNPVDKNEPTKSTLQTSKSDETKPTGLEPADVNSGGWRPPNINVGDIKTSSTNSGSPKPGPRNDVVVDNEHSKPSPKKDGTNPVDKNKTTKSSLQTSKSDETKPTGLESADVNSGGWRPPNINVNDIKTSSTNSGSPQPGPRNDVVVDNQHSKPSPKKDGTNPVDKNKTTKSSLQTSKSDETKPTGLEPADVNSGGWRPPNINVNDIKTSSTNSGSPQPGPRNDVVVDNQHLKPSPKDDGTNPTENIEPITKQAVATNLNSTNGWHPPRFSKGSTVGKQHLNLIPKEDGTNPVDKNKTTKSSLQTSKSDETKPTGLEPADVNSGGWRPPNINVNDIKTSSTNSGSPKPGPRNDVVVDNQHSKPSPKEDGTNPTENIEPITKQAVATNLNSTNGWHPPRFSKGSTVGKQHLNLIPKEDGTNPVDKNEPTKSTLQTSKSDETKPTGLEPADVNSGGWRPPNINVGDIKTSSTNSGSPKPGPRNDVVVDNEHSKPSPKKDGTNPVDKNKTTKSSLQTSKSDETKPTGLEPADVNSGGWRPPNINVNDIKTSSTNSGSPQPGPRNDVVVDNQHLKPSPKDDGTNPTENIEPITKQAVATNLNSTNGWHPPRFSKGSTVGKQHLNPIPKEDGTNPVDKNKTTKSSLQTSKSDETKPTGLEPADVNSGGWRPPNINVNDIKTSSTNSGSPRPGPRNDVVVDNQHSKPSPKKDGTNPVDKNKTTKSSLQTSKSDETKPTGLEPADVNSGGWRPPNINVGDIKTSSTNSGLPQPGPRNDLTKDNENKPIPQTDYITNDESEPSEEYEEVVEKTEYVNGQEIKTITVTKYNNAEDNDETRNSTNPPFILQLYDAKPGDIVWVPANDENVNSNEDEECIEIDNENDSCS